MAKFTRTSMISGVSRTREIPITVDQWNQYIESGILIQNAFPELRASEREFLKTGIIDEEWDRFDDEGLCGEFQDDSIGEQ